MTPIEPQITPSERKDARIHARYFLAPELRGVSDVEPHRLTLATHLHRALKQIDDDEALMRQGNRAIISALLRLDFHGCEDVKESLVAASYALRARLGEAPATEDKP